MRTVEDAGPYRWITMPLISFPFIKKEPQNICGSPLFFIVHQEIIDP